MADALKTEFSFRHKLPGGASVGSTMTNLNHGILNRLPVAVPPVAEQSRIVAKVAQLITLCDELEAKIKANASTAQRFAEAVVAELAA
jgi:type I restriction enzyme S subunit